MSRRKRRHSRMTGLPPGTLISGDASRPGTAGISLVRYSAESFEERPARTVDECAPHPDSSGVTWIHIDGAGSPDVIARIGEVFNVHALLLEDILTVERPKLEDFEEYLYIVLNAFPDPRPREEIEPDQVSIILGPSYVISIQDHPSPVFDSVRLRLRNARGRIRRMGADYLAYSLVDAIVDGYFTVAEVVGDEIEEIETELMENPGSDVLRRLQHLRREILFLRKSIWPAREVVSSLRRRESPLIRAGTDVFLRDVYDHSIQVVDTLEIFRDMLSGMVEIYLSAVNNRLNEVMKMLTMIATIFMPLSFIAGVYGMNFRHMPELGSPWGYPLALLLMLTVGISMLVYFRRRTWI